MVEERVGVAAELENAEPLVDHHACRAISGEQHAVCLAKHLGSDGGLPGPALPPVQEGLAARIADNKRGGPLAAFLQ